MSGRRGAGGRGGRPRQEERGAPPARETVVGTLERRGRLTVVRPFFERGRPVVVERTREARPGQLVLAGAGRRSRGGARVLRVIGDPARARDVLEAHMLERGLARRFPPGVGRSADEAIHRAMREGEAREVVRRDLRSLATFTIDPASARDFDDAISAEELGAGRRRVWVHIADVTAFVRPGSPVDREAYLRGTSVYVAGAVEPMLPEALSNGACSLVPGEDRFAVTAELEVAGGEVASAAFYRSLIRSDARLDYDRVDRIFDGSERGEEPWSEPLRVARAASAELRERRRAQGSLQIESSEPEFAFDEDGEVAAVAPAVQTESHELIEHLMVAANEAVARLLSSRGAAALYRVHERPEPAAVERLLAQLASLDVPTPPAPERIDPAQAPELVVEASRLVADEVRRRGGAGGAGLGSLLLRALKQARYDPVNLGHFGLRSTAYCHFTSPIRRYPDIVCHRALLHAIGAGEREGRGGAALAEAAQWTSQRERDAMKIERDGDDIALAFLLERRMLAGELPASWPDAEVVGLVGAGAFMRFGGAFEGFLPARRLGGDWWDLNEQGTVLLGATGGGSLRIGQQLDVTLHRIEPSRGRVDLDLA